MSAKTGIEWTDATWSPLRVCVKQDAAEIARAKGYGSLVQIAGKMAGHVGPHCEHVSDGCAICYSGTNNGRCLPANGTGLPFDRRSRDLVDPIVDEKILTQPLRWRKGKRIFVENQSDLFGEWVPLDQIDRVFAVMALCPQHTFQVLTKRSKRMREYLTIGPWGQIEMAAEELLDENPKLRRIYSVADALHVDRIPLPNIWLGVSCEDQQRANERIPDLLATPAAVRFLSVEPLLGPVDLDLPRCDAHDREETFFDEELGCECCVPCRADGRIGELSYGHWLDPLNDGIAWVIVGGESGAGARPMHPQWARSLRDQCQAAGVPYFFKQHGAWVSCSEVAGKGKHFHFPDGATVRRVGKKKAGSMLDGVEWKQFPEVAQHA